ncbi:MAG: hypothetical protein PW734_00990 [Verrucomicrobium sp.]|nr:hypothetical protein [Verrucomicrobium sp.]
MAPISSRRGSGPFWITTVIVLALVAGLGWAWKRQAARGGDLPSGRAFQVPGGALSTEKPEELSFYSGQVILAVLRGTGSYYDYSVFPACSIIQYPPRPTRATGNPSGTILPPAGNAAHTPGTSFAAQTPSSSKPSAPKAANGKEGKALPPAPPGPVSQHPNTRPRPAKTQPQPGRWAPDEALRFFTETDLPSNSKFIDAKTLLRTSNGAIEVIIAKCKGQTLTRAQWEAIKPDSTRAAVVVDEDWNPISRITP